MNKYLKYSLWAVGGILAVVLAGAAYLAATFDPNAYKSQIIKAVKERTQRDLRLDGDIALTFFPSLGADIGKVSLSERNSEKQFASLDQAHVSLKLMPLFSRQAVVDEIRLSGLQAEFVKRKDGTTNIDDLLGGRAAQGAEKAAGNSQPANFDITAVSIEKTVLTYRDENSGAQYTIKDLNLHSRRIASGVPADIDLTATVQANQPKLDLAAQVKTTLTFDLDKQLYKLEGLDLQASGAALDIQGLKLQASGDVNADMGAQQFGARKFALKVGGAKDKDVFEMVLGIPTLHLAKNEYSGELALDIELKQPEQAFKVKLASPLSGNLEARQFDLGALVLAVQASGDKLPNKSVNSEMKGSVQLDAQKETVRASLAGGLLQSKVKARVGVNGFEKPAIDFDVEVDQFDADLYLPNKTAEASKPNGPEQPLDLSVLRKLDLNGSLRIGALKVANVKADKVRLEVKAHNGLLNVSPLSANLYQGSLNGSLSVNARGTPAIGINQSLNGINVAALTKDAAGFDTLEGKGNVGMNLTMQGNTVGAMKKALDGTLSLNLADGAIKGINIAKSLREFGKSGTAKTQDANAAEKTDFSELKASFKVNDGVAHNDDLSLKSPLLRLSGNGDIDIGQSRMNYLAKATLAKTLEGQGGKDVVAGLTVPVRVSGPFDGLKYTLDFGAMVGEAAKQKVEARKEEVKTRLQDKLKGLFR